MKMVWKRIEKILKEQEWKMKIDDRMKVGQMEMIRQAKADQYCLKRYEIIPMSPSSALLYKPCQPSLPALHMEEMMLVTPLAR